jgi:hypothetical protein
MVFEKTRGLLSVDSGALLSGRTKEPGAWSGPCGTRWKAGELIYPGEFRVVPTRKTKVTPASSGVTARRDWLFFQHNLGCALHTRRKS